MDAEDTHNKEVILPLPVPPQYLGLLEGGRRLLAEARTVYEVKELRDKAEALRLYLRQQQDGEAAQRDAAELRLRAERKLGELLRGTVNHAGSRGVGRTVRPTLPDGVTKSQSHRWQRVARVPEAAFETYLADCRETGADITTAGAAALARLPEKPRAEPSPLEDACTTDDLRRLVATGQKFGTIYADPPWPYRNGASRGACARHYATMTLEEIAALPVAELAAGAAHLHLWTTTAFLAEALAVMGRWGFRYTSHMVWCKGTARRERDGKTGKFTGWMRVRPQLGCGNYWRVSHELLLLGVRGGAPFADKRLPSYFIGRRGRHSEKPDEVRQMVERASPGARLELFARSPSPGWTCWGDQVSREGGLFLRVVDATPQ
jgi:N6-adenosine-specific RNA methylase IME4